MKVKHLILPLAFACTSGAMAASDGTLDPVESTGSTDITISVPEAVQVSVQGDITLALNAGNYTGNTGICIYHRGVSTAGLTLVSSNEDDQGGSHAPLFNLVSTGNLLPYSTAISGVDTITSLVSSTKETVSNATTDSTNCGGGFPHQLDITVQGSDFDAVPAGTYTDTLSILVSPT